MIAALIILGAVVVGLGIESGRLRWELAASRARANRLERRVLKVEQHLGRDSERFARELRRCSDELMEDG